METLKIKINTKNLYTQLASVKDSTLERKTKQIINEKIFTPAVNEMIEEFESHPITQEIEGGIDAENISNTLKGNFPDDEGKNLFSFIGFRSGDNPIQKIRRFFSLRSKFGPKLQLKTVSKARLVYTYEISAPDIEQIYKSTPMPWAPGLSWVRRMETGIPGLGRFLNKIGAKNSRSGGGVQVKNELRSARFAPKKYLSTIFNNFLKRVSNRKQ